MKSVFFLPVTFFCFFLSGSSWPGLAAPEDAAPEDADVLADAFSAGLRLSMIPRAKDGTSVETAGIRQLLVLPIAISNDEKEAKHICLEFDSFQIGLLVF